MGRNFRVFPLESRQSRPVMSLKSSYRGSGGRCKLPSENRIWCILALVIRRSGQTHKVPNNCMRSVGSLSGGTSYCAGISSVSYCSLLTKPPNPFCSANANSPEAEFPNSPPNAAPLMFESAESERPRLTNSGIILEFQPM